MPVSAPPFDPPYVSMHVTDERTEYIETLVDGTTRTVPETAFGLAWHFAREEAGSPPSNGSAVPRGNRPTSSPSSSSKVYLNVPFAEKDEAKALGARWDAARKKWYAPQGAEVGRFERWLPQA